MIKSSLLATAITAVASLVHVLATSSSVADSNERTETGRAIPLFKAVLQELPQTDSVYAGFENGAWLQVRRISELNDEQRGRLRATPGANIAINLVRPSPSGELPMRRIFEDQQGNEVGQLDLWKRTQSTARPRRASLPGSPCGQTGVREAQLSV
jgi:adenylate cyclase